MALLNTLLEHHSRNLPQQAIPDSLGDGYLYSFNPIFRKVRDFIISEDVRFSLQTPAEVNVLPLAQLESFLQSKKLYLVDQFSVLKAIENKNPGKIQWLSLISHIKRNTIFHESCHLLARHFLKPTQQETKSQAVVRLLLEESVANTCELLAIKDVHDSLHRHFYELNSYIFHFEAKKLISELMADFGAEQIFRWTLMNYLFSNFLFDFIPDSEFRRVLELTGLSAEVKSQDLKRLKALGKIAFQLNPDFKFTTTDFYLTYHGYIQNLDEIKGIDFMTELEKNQSIQKSIHLVSKFIIS